MEPPLQPEISIRPLRSHSDLDASVALQKAVWGYGDLDVDSRAMLTVASRFAGQMLGAFHDEQLIGFTLAFATLPAGRLHSHRVGVHPAYQNLGIGRRLKLAQRDDALERGVPIIQWTFDPLQPRNAYFNLVRLGGIARTYIPNLYGITTSPLHGGLPTDRLLIEWELDSERVRRILAGDTPPATGRIREIRVPTGPELKKATVQSRLREEFLAELGDGYAVTGCSQESDSLTYVLEK